MSGQRIDDFARCTIPHPSPAVRQEPLCKTLYALAQRLVLLRGLTQRFCKEALERYRNSRSSLKMVWKSMCSILQILQVYWLFPAPSRLLDSPTKSYFSFNSALSKRAILSRSVCSCAESTVESERKEWSSRSSDTDECTIELQYIVMPHCSIPSSALSNFYPLLRLLAGSFLPFHHMLNNGFNHFLLFILSAITLPSAVILRQLKIIKDCN